jgi:hypothetical protein
MIGAMQTPSENHPISQIGTSLHHQKLEPTVSESWQTTENS